MRYMQLPRAKKLLLLQHLLARPIELGQSVASIVVRLCLVVFAPLGVVVSLAGAMGIALARRLDSGPPWGGTLRMGEGLPGSSALAFPKENRGLNCRRIYDPAHPCC